MLYADGYSYRVPFDPRLLDLMYSRTTQRENLRSSGAATLVAEKLASGQEQQRRIFQALTKSSFSVRFESTADM